MDTYLMKNDEHMQDEQVQRQYQPVQYQQQKYPQLQYCQNQYPQQQYPPQGGVGNLEVKESNKEEDLVEEEAKPYVIIVSIQDIFPEIVKVLRKIVHIVNNLITLSTSVCSSLQNGRIELSLTSTWCRI